VGRKESRTILSLLESADNGNEGRKKAINLKPKERGEGGKTLWAFLLEWLPLTDTPQGEGVGGRCWTHCLLFSQTPCPSLFFPSFWRKP